MIYPCTCSRPTHSPTIRRAVYWLCEGRAQGSSDGGSALLPGSDRCPRQGGWLWHSRVSCDGFLRSTLCKGPEMGYMIHSIMWYNAPPNEWAPLKFGYLLSAELHGSSLEVMELLFSLLLDYYSIEMYTQIRLIVNGVVVDAALCLWHFLTCIS